MSLGAMYLFFFSFFPLMDKRHFLTPPISPPPHLVHYHALSTQPNLDGTLKVLLYAPGTKDGEMHMSSILRSLDMPYVSSPLPSSPVLRTVLVNNGWVLLPVNDPSSSSSSSSSSDDLSSLLVDALEKTRGLLVETSTSWRKTSSSSPKPTVVANGDDNGAVLFLGMDSPELPMEEVVYGLGISSGIGRLLLDGRGPGRRRRRRNDDDDEHDDDNVDRLTTFVGKAHMCPANDGKNILGSSSRNSVYYMQLTSLLSGAPFRKQAGTDSYPSRNTHRRLAYSRAYDGVSR